GGGGRAGVGAAVVGAPGDGAGAGARVVAAASGAADAGAGRETDWAAVALEAAPTVTIGVIFSIVFFGTPAFVRSATDANGRPAMIFFAVAGPTPGRASRSACDAVLRFTRAAGALAGGGLSAPAGGAWGGTGR